MARIELRKNESLKKALMRFKRKIEKEDISRFLKNENITKNQVNTRGKKDENPNP